MAYQEYRKASQVNNYDSERARGEAPTHDFEGKLIAQKGAQEKDEMHVIPGTAEQPRSGAK